MYLGIKERRRYRDISWLMGSIDIESALELLGTKIHGRSGDRVVGFCPDHHLFVNRRPSHPRWLLNTETGDTFCLTEGRGSNLVWTFCRLHNCSPSDAVKLLTGSDEDSIVEKLKSNLILGKVKRLREGENKPPPKAVVGLDDISRDLVSRLISGRCYQFFIHPPGKSPTDIRSETVDRYRVFERTWGYYADRAIIPFFMRGELKGFAAVDMLGEEVWRKRHPVSDNYRKTLTAINFRVGEYLFGFDDCAKDADFIVITEGPREVMKLWQEGFPNTVATMGINVAPGQLQLLAELAPKRLVLMYDNDDRGFAAMEKLEAKLSRQFPAIGKALCPRGKDPKNLNRKELTFLLNRAGQPAEPTIHFR